MSLADLYKKLAKAKRNFPKIEKKGVNTFFKSAAHPQGAPYMTYEDIVHGIQPALLNEGLDFQHTSRFSDRHFFVGTKIIEIDTGYETPPFEMPLSYDDNAQKQSASITYAKRVTLCGEVGLAADGDDDGNEASEHHNHQAKLNQAPPKQSPQPPPPPRPNPSKAQEPISEAQAKRLWAITKGSGWTQNDLKELLDKGFGVSSTKDIKRKDYETICNVVSQRTYSQAMKELAEFQEQPRDPLPPPLSDKDMQMFEEIPF